MVGSNSVLSRGSSRSIFASNWIAGSADTRYARRRLMAVLRMAHRVLGINKSRLGLGALGINGSCSCSVPGNSYAASAIPAIFTISLAIFPQQAAAQNYNAGAGSVATGGGGTAVGSNASATAGAGSPVAVGSGAKANAGTPGGSPIAIGVNANASGVAPVGFTFEAVAIGNSATATGAWSTSIGSDSSATGTGASAFGTSAHAKADRATAIGNGAEVTAEGSIAMGYVSKATGLRSTALGFNANVAADNSIAMGYNANVTGSGASIAIGYNSNVTGASAVALGNTASVSADFGGVAIGILADSSATNATALGRQASASAANAIAMGTNASADTAEALAIGTNSVATGGKAVSIGSNNVAYGDGAVAIGDPSYASGTGAFVGGANNIANNDGTASATAANAANGVIAIGNSNVAVGQGSVALGNTSRAGGAGALALGDSAIATNSADVAIGSGALATGNGFPAGMAIAVGAGQATDAGAIAIGNAFNGGTQASGRDTVAIGTEARASGSIATALGGGSVATGTQSVALGFRATSNQTDALALGTNAIAGASAGDVALGAGSVTAAPVATPNTVINGTTYDFAGINPTSTVSVGNVGAERTITNVAAGRISDSSTDAVNGSQLYATNQAVDNLGTTVDQNTTDIANLDGRMTTVEGDVMSLNNTVTNINNGGGIKYFHANSTLPDSQAIGTDSVAIGPNAVATNAGDVAVGLNSTSSTTTAVGGATIGGSSYTFAGAVPSGAFSVGSAGAERQIQNVAAGQLSDTSTDAVNGSQLFATNQAVDKNTTDISNLAGNITNIGDTITNIAGDTSSTYTDANGDGIRYVRTNDRTLPVTDSFAQGVGSSAIGYNATAVADNSLALGRDSQTTIEGGVALGSGSVSGRALAPTTGQLTAGPSGFIEYNTTDKILLGAVSVGTDTAYRQIINVADGIESQDAVTVRQLQGAIASVAATPSKYFHANSTAGDSLAVGAESIAVGPTTVVNGDNGIGIGNGATVDQLAAGGTAIGQDAHVSLADGVAIGTQSKANGIQSIALGAGATSNHINSVAIGASSVTSVGAEAGYTAFALAAAQSSVGEVSFGSVGSERKLTNVAAGSADTDAVNVSQLKGVASQITNHLGGGAVVNPDGTITGPTYNIQGGSYTTVYDGFTAVDNSLTNLQNQINGGGGIKYFHANSSLADSSAIGTDSVAIGPESVANGTGSLAAGRGSNAVGQGSVALGEGARANNASDVALGSGSVSESAVGTSGTTIRGKNYDFAGAAPVGTVSVGSDGAERTITNVAAGRINADSTDAINGSQLHATNQAIESIEGGIDNINNNAVFYDLNPDGSKKNSVTLVGGDVNAPVVISNVGKGVNDTDAVNVAQLTEGFNEVKTYTDNRVNYAIEAANDYTDQKFAQLNSDLGGIRSEARTAAAIGLAAASLRYDDRPGKLSVAVGGGYWRGEGALAFGTGYTSEDGRMRANLSGTVADGDVGVGGGLSFTLN